MGAAGSGAVAAEQPVIAKDRQIAGARCRIARRFRDHDRRHAGTGDDPKRRAVMSETITVGLDLAQNVFQVHGTNTFLSASG